MACPDRLPHLLIWRDGQPTDEIGLRCVFSSAPDEQGWVAQAAYYDAPPVAVIPPEETP